MRPQATEDRRQLAVDARQVVHELVDGELILIHLARGNYFSLSGSGPRIWSLLSAGVSPAETIASLESIHAGEAGAIEREVGELVRQLLEEELLHPTGASGEPADDAREDRPDGETRAERPFDPPRLEKYTDMQDYLLIDPIHEVEQPGWPQGKAGTAGKAG